MPVSMLSTSLLSNKRSYSRFNALDTIYTPPVLSKPGMVLIKPTSISHSGTSASIGANGQVTFTAVTSLSLNGVFSADFDNYVVSVRGTISTSGAAIQHRWRASGSDASGSDYVNQYLEAEGTNVTSSRGTAGTTKPWSSFSNTREQGFTTFIYGPFLSQPTAYRSVSVQSYLGATITEYAGTHSLSTSYDGFTIFPQSNAITGALQVYGVRS